MKASHKKYFEREHRIIGRKLNEVEGLQYLGTICFVLENMQISPGRQISWNLKEIIEHTDLSAL